MCIGYSLSSVLLDRFPYFYVIFIDVGVKWVPIFKQSIYAEFNKWLVYRLEKCMVRCLGVVIRRILLDAEWEA